MNKPNNIDIVVYITMIVLLFGSIYLNYTVDEQINQAHIDWQAYYNNSLCYNPNPTPGDIYYNGSHYNNTDTPRPSS